MNQSPSTIRNGLSILHQVPEGHVGVYWRGGALQKTITDPGLTMVISLWFSFSSCFPRTYEISACTLFLGFHLKLPFITHYEPVQVTLQTDQVKFNAMKIEGFHLVSLIKSFLWV